MIRLNTGFDGLNYTTALIEDALLAFEKQGVMTVHQMQIVKACVMHCRDKAYQDEYERLMKSQEISDEADIRDQDQG